ncbi:MAG: tyrosine-type recombinase/integrase [Hadesarchaea archaeon]|nr:tyrosine-type recombinase/integrase [Hadesarchaea archaeon]
MKVIASEIMASLEPWARRTIADMSPSRRRAVGEFLQALEDDKVGPHTMRNYIAALRTLNGAKSYKQLGETDIRAWAREIDGRYKPRTALVYEFNIKRFLKWVHTGHLDGDGYPECVKWIKAPRSKANFGGEILSKAEVKQLADAANHQRDRALLFVLYESGARASELVGLKIGDVSFDQYGAVLRIGRGPNAKSGERRVRLFESVPDLQLWLSMHPNKDNPEASLFANQHFKDRGIQRRALRVLVAKYAKRAGLNKRISPHTFRHSRATHLASVLKEAQMREFFGWANDSKMPSVYVHLSGRDVDQSLFEHYGIKPREDGNEDSPLKKKVCPRCNIENSASARFCWRCWAAFDTAKADELTARVMEELIKRAPELLRQVLKEKGLDQEIVELARGEK